RRSRAQPVLQGTQDDRPVLRCDGPLAGPEATEACPWPAYRWQAVAIAPNDRPRRGILRPFALRPFIHFPCQINRYRTTPAPTRPAIAPPHTAPRAPALRPRIPVAVTWMSTSRRRSKKHWET